MHKYIEEYTHCAKLLVPHRRDLCSLHILSSVTATIKHILDNFSLL